MMIFRTLALAATLAVLAFSGAARAATTYDFSQVFPDGTVISGTLSLDLNALTTPPW
jgi:hypothetical protein